MQDLKIAVHIVLRETELAKHALSEGHKALFQGDKAAKAEAKAEAIRRQEEEDAANLARAAQYVRISGAVNKDGGAILRMNGDYEKTGDVRNGRAVYKKVGDDDRAMWMSANGRWFMGPKQSIGGTGGLMAAIMDGCEVLPELVGGGWQVGSNLSAEADAERAVRKMNSTDKQRHTSKLPSGVWSSMTWVQRYEFLRVQQEEEVAKANRRQEEETQP